LTSSANAGAIDIPFVRTASQLLEFGKMFNVVANIEKLIKKKNIIGEENIPLSASEIASVMGHNMIVDLLELRSLYESRKEIYKL
jgi:hypothetical protein